MNKFKGSKKLVEFWGYPPTPLYRNSTDIIREKFNQNENLNHTKPRGSLGVYCTNFFDIVLFGRRRDFFNILTNTIFSQELLFLLLYATR